MTLLPPPNSLFSKLVVVLTILLFSCDQSTPSSVIDPQISLLTAQIESIQNRLETLQSTYDGLDLVNQQQAEALEVQNGKVSDLAKVGADQKKLIDATRLNLASLQVENKEQQATIATQESQVERLEVALQDRETLLKDLEDKNKELTVELGSIREALSEAREKVAELETSNADLSVKISGIKGTIADSEAEADELEKNLADLIESIEEAEREREKAEREKAEREREREETETGSDDETVQDPTEAQDDETTQTPTDSTPSSSSGSSTTQTTQTSTPTQTKPTNTGQEHSIRFANGRPIYEPDKFGAGKIWRDLRRNTLIWVGDCSKLTFDSNGVATHVEFKGNTVPLQLSYLYRDYVLINNQGGNYIVSAYNGGVVDLSKVVTTCVTNMASLLSGYAKNRYVNADISSWDVYNVTTMESMFGSGSDFDADITKWDVRNVENMRGMFQANTVFNQDIGGWDVSSVTNMERMFQGSTSIFNRDISRWDVSSVTDMSDMFSGNMVFNQDLTAWNSKLCGRTIDSQSFDTTTPAWTKPKPTIADTCP